MAERQQLLQSIANTITDYHTGDTSEAHVDKWANQFDAGVRLPILREMDHVLKRTYFSRPQVERFLRNLLVRTKKLVGDDPCAFWKDVQFLDIQLGGGSQRDMLKVVDGILEDKCGLKVAACGKRPKAFLYLDDGIFTGSRVHRDLQPWITDEAPKTARLHIATIAQHSGGYYFAKSRIEKAARDAKKAIDTTWWYAIKLETTKDEPNNSDVLRPTSIPDDAAVRKYVKAMTHEPVLRKAGNVGPAGIFSSEAGRHLLEQQFLIAGVKIRNMCPNLPLAARPLGHMNLAGC